MTPVCGGQPYIRAKHRRNRSGEVAHHLAETGGAVGVQHGEQRVHRTLALFGRKRGDPMVQLLVKQLRTGTQIRLGDEPVSYTHLTLPTKA